MSSQNDKIVSGFLFNVDVKHSQFMALPKLQLCKLRSNGFYQRALTIRGRSTV